MQKLKNWLTGLSDVLPDLLIGIFMYGIVCEIIGCILQHRSSCRYFVCNGHGGSYGMVAGQGA